MDSFSVGNEVISVVLFGMNEYYKKKVSCKRHHIIPIMLHLNKVEIH